MVFRRDERLMSKQTNICTRNEDGSGFTGMDAGGVVRPQCCSGGGGLWSSPKSYIKLLQAVLNDGVYKPTGVRILDKASIDLMGTPHITKPEILQGLADFLKRDIPPPFVNEGHNPKHTLGLGIKVMEEEIPGGRSNKTLYGDGYPCAPFCLPTWSRPS
jgi:CubicO group peptidase (beta-lactamase class C family)